LAAQPSHVTCKGDARASTGFWMTTAVALREGSDDQKRDAETGAGTRL
jgi:hypothetical protein